MYKIITLFENSIVMSQSSNQLRQKITKQEGWISIVVNVVLFAIKYFAGISCGSLALIADAWHTLSDSISSIFVLISSKFSFKEPDKKHPFGHGRFELVTSIFIGVLLSIVGFSFIKEGIVKLVSKEEANYGLIAIIVTVISILMKEGLAQFAFWGYRKTNSGALKADGWHHRSDSVSSIVILVGVLIGKYFWWIDGVLSIVVAGFLLKASYQIIRDTISIILGEEPSDEFYDEISLLANTAAGVNIGMHHLHVHNYITHKEITFHICLSPDLTIDKAHCITNAIEILIKNELDIEATVHINPKRIN